MNVNVTNLEVLKAWQPVSGLPMRGAPVWTQYIAISTVHDDPKQCEHVLSYYFAAVTWDVTVTYMIIYN